MGSLVEGQWPTPQECLLGYWELPGRPLAAGDALSSEGLAKGLGPFLYKR